MKRLVTILIGLLSVITVNAGDTLRVKTFQAVGPVALQRPLMVDSVDFEGKTFDAASLLDMQGSSFVSQAEAISPVLPAEGQAVSYLHQKSFNLLSQSYAKAKVEVLNTKDFRLFLDGQKCGAEVTLEPRQHQVLVQYLSDTSDGDSIVVQVTTEQEGALSVNLDGKRPYTLSDVTDGRRISGIELSPDGKFLIAAHTTTFPGGRTQSTWQLLRLKDRAVMTETTERMAWFGLTGHYYITRQGANGRTLITVDPQTGQQTTTAAGIPEGQFYVAPQGDFLLYMLQQEGPKRDAQVYEIVEPDDRQPGWRTRTRLARYDLATATLQPLTYGYHNVYLQDISPDGRYLLVMTSHSRLTQRPTTLSTLLQLDLQTLRADTLIRDDGFIAGAQYAPDGRQVVVIGSPECLGGIGKNVPDDRIPSMYDYQLYLFNGQSWKPLTRDFNPCVKSFWSKYDEGVVYFTAEDLDFVHLFRCNPKDGKITRIDVPEEMVNGVSMAYSGPVLAFYGEGASNGDRLYVLDTKKQKSMLLEDTNTDLLRDVELGECHPWNYVSERGDTIYGRYYLPPHFDAAKRYPMIVNYYGGCSPTSRNFESRYPQHAYAAQGYVVYVVNPSGATGFGQEFSSRHVNTAGEGVAQDIIEGVRRFCREHTFVDEKKIGCIGASYGGFMTQYLQTKTDLFAAAISHAGISDHTSYWGEGYWGYSYSEVSMAESYPWTRKDLYVDRSPLFNADKIHTPLLFLHGSADTNVPFGESIQMFNALKLLGRPTAFVVVDGENHWVMDYQKRIKWQNTIFAWFARYLKDDPTWWNALYPEKNL